ncbi:hypothetical protein TNCV_4594471 [Trichonephila clavipes]|uniref:Uncharacterized protein n=1 Tax=Trichonephila clavipes TaxID=2585209 RepID=A0A8X7BJP4_TRICX|nr:hypothetical protein TNCV_4594471 [Trichonephila clavipes]
MSNTSLAIQIASVPPIEHVWDMMGRRLYLPGNVDDLAPDHWSKFGKKYRRRPSGHLDCENSPQSHIWCTLMWETAKVEFLHSAERHDGHWLKRGDPGGVPKVLDGVEGFLARMRA